MKNAPDLSIVVACVLPWPALRGCLNSIYPQARALNAEIIVATREGGVSSDQYPGVVHVVEPSGTLFSLRAAAFSKSTGRVIALTEDHCHVRSDWCESHLRCHAENPEAVAIIGCVENSARDRLSEWAAYMLGNGAFMSPLPHGAYTGEITSANFSFKRSAMPSNFPEAGWSGVWHAKWLAERGEVVSLDGAAVVDHHLQISMSQAVSIFYRAARSSAGIEPGLAAGPAVARAAMEFLKIPVNAIRTGLRIAVHKGRFRGTAILAIPAIALLMIAHHSGVALAAIHGPGKAPDLLY